MFHILTNVMLSEGINLIGRGVGWWGGVTVLEAGRSVDHGGNGCLGRVAKFDYLFTFETIKEVVGGEWTFGFD